MNDIEFIGLFDKAITAIREYGWYSPNTDCFIFDPQVRFSPIVEENGNLFELFCYTADEFKDEITLHFRKGVNHADITLTMDSIDMSDIVKDVADSVYKTVVFRKNRHEEVLQEWVRREVERRRILL